MAFKLVYTVVLDGPVPQPDFHVSTSPALVTLYFGEARITLKCSNFLLYTNRTSEITSLT